MANSRTMLLAVVLLCACGVAFSKDDVVQQLDAKIQTSVETAVKHQFESNLNTQITKLIDERLPATVTPQVEDTFNKQQSKIVDEVLKVINSQESDDDSSGAAIDAERLVAAESSAAAAQKQLKELLARIGSLEATLASERASTEKFTTSARNRIDSISSLIADVIGDQKKHEAAIQKNMDNDEKLMKQSVTKSAGGVTQEQVQATVRSEFDVLKKMNDANEKTVHQLKLKIGELKTIIDNPKNGVQEQVQDLSQRVGRFQGELDDVRENVVRQQFKENRDMANKNKDALEKATTKLAKQQKKLDANVEEDGKLKAAYEKEKKRLNDLVTALAKRLTQLEAEVSKGGLEKYWTLTKEWITTQNQRFYQDVYVEHIKNFNSDKLGKALLRNTQAFADWSFKSGGSLGKYLATKFTELTASTRKFLAEFYKDFEPAARQFLSNAYATTADLTNKALKNAGPAMQEVQRLAVVYSKEGVQLYEKVHKDAVQQFIDMKFTMDNAILAATVALISVLALIASIALFIVYKIVAGFFSCVFGACCGRSSGKKTKKSQKREEAGADEPKSPSKNTSGSRKKKAKKGTRGKYDTL